MLLIYFSPAPFLVEKTATHSQTLQKLVLPDLTVSVYGSFDGLGKTYPAIGFYGADAALEARAKGFDEAVH